MKRLSFFALGSATLLATTPVLAGSYQAICGGTKCTVIVGAGEIRSPMGSIPPERVTDWGGGGNSKTSIGTGVATTVLLGPLGLLGFMAKNHDFNFVVNGYDRQGRRTSLDIQFKNDKPAKRFIEEMQRLTGLGMGQIRTAQDIKNAESAASEAGLTGTLDGDAAAEKVAPTNIIKRSPILETETQPKAEIQSKTNKSKNEEPKRKIRNLGVGRTLIRTK